jgi:hypothetical protein
LKPKSIKSHPGAFSWPDGNFAWQKPENMLESYSLARMEAELLLANRLLRASLGVLPTSFAYCCAQTFVGRGKRVRSYVPLVAKNFLVGRGRMSQTHNRPDLCDLAQICSSGLDNQTFETICGLIEAAAADGGWIVLTGREVGTSGERQTTGAHVLRKVCRYLFERQDLWTETVSTVGRHVMTMAGHS